MAEAYEDAAGEVSSATMDLEVAFRELKEQAARKNQGFLPPAIREGFPKAIADLDALFQALSELQ